jgi:hypothetical protein
VKSHGVGKEGHLLMPYAMYDLDPNEVAANFDKRGARSTVVYLHQPEGSRYGHKACDLSDLCLAVSGREGGEATPQP